MHDQFIPIEPGTLDARHEAVTVQLAGVPHPTDSQRPPEGWVLTVVSSGELRFRHEHCSSVALLSHALWVARPPDPEDPT